MTASPAEGTQRWALYCHNAKSGIGYEILEVYRDGKWSPPEESKSMVRTPRAPAYKENPDLPEYLRPITTFSNHERFHKLYTRLEV